LGIFPEAMKGIEEFAKRWERGAEVPGIVKKVDERNSDEERAGELY